MIYIGIDPGKAGAVCALNSEGGQEVTDTPVVSGKGKNLYDIAAMRDLLAGYQIESTSLIVSLELVHAMPKQGVTSMFSMGEGYGLWQGLMSALRIPYVLVTPQAWMKVVLAGYGIKDENASYLVASKLYPELPLKGPKGGIKDGRADATCLAEYARRTWSNQVPSEKGVRP